MCANDVVKLFFSFGNLYLFHLLEQLAGEDQFVELFVGRGHHFVFVALPFLSAFIDEDDVFANAHYGVHVVGVDDGGHVVFFGDAREQLVDNQ